MLAPAVLTGCGFFRPTLRAHRVFSMPRPNQVIETQGVWQGAKPLRLTLTQPGTGLTVPAEIRAIHDGASICFLVIWPDPTQSQERRMWVWDDSSRRYFLREFNTDWMAFKFPISGSKTACMMTGEEGVYDVWQWRDGWSHVSGRAEDRRLIISRTEPESGGAAAYPSREPGVMIYLKWIEDEGQPPIELRDRPRSFERPVTYAFKAAHPTGSAGDVLVEAVYQQKNHALEIMRALRTGHEDDYQFEGKGPHPFAISVANEDDGEGHFTSELIWLYLD